MKQKIRGIVRRLRGIADLTGGGRANRAEIARLNQVLLSVMDGHGQQLQFLQGELERLGIKIDAQNCDIDRLTYLYDSASVRIAAMESSQRTTARLGITSLGQLPRDIEPGARFGVDEPNAAG